jgi:hypothetical protein
MHDVVRDSNAQSPLIVPGATGPAQVRVRRPRPWLAFSGQGSSARKLPDVPTDRAQPEQHHAGRASLAGRGRFPHRGHRLRPAGSPAVFPPRSRGTPHTTTLVLAGSDELVASPEPKGRRRAGRGSSV